MKYTDENKPANLKSDSGKRSFIKKATVAAGIATLAPTSVWGACNASGVSGGSKDTDTNCAMPSYSEGRSPEWWVRWLDTSPSGRDKNIVAELLNDVSKSEKFDRNTTVGSYTGKDGNKKKLTYYHAVADKIATLTFNMTTRDKDMIKVFGSEGVDLNVSAALTGGNSTLADLAAVYLNKVFGLSQLTFEYETESGFQMLLDHYFGMSFHVETFSSDMSARYTDAATISESQLIALLNAH